MCGRINVIIILLCKQEEIKKYCKTISDKDSQIEVLKLAEKANKDLLIKMAEMKLKREGSTATDVVR